MGKIGSKSNQQVLDNYKSEVISSIELLNNSLNTIKIYKKYINELQKKINEENENLDLINLEIKIHNFLKKINTNHYDSVYHNIFYNNKEEIRTLKEFYENFLNFSKFDLFNDFFYLFESNPLGFLFIILILFFSLYMLYLEKKQKVDINNFLINEILIKNKNILKNYENNLKYKHLIKKLNVIIDVKNKKQLNLKKYYTQKDKIGSDFYFLKKKIKNNDNK